jgi:hypothetical protein
MGVTDLCLPLWFSMPGCDCTAATYTGGDCFGHSSAFLEMQHRYPNLFCKIYGTGIPIAEISSISSWLTLLRRLCINQPYVRLS